MRGSLLWGFCVFLHLTGVSQSQLAPWIEVIPDDGAVEQVPLEGWVEDWWTQGDGQVLIVIFRKDQEVAVDWQRRRRSTGGREGIPGQGASPLLFDCLPVTASDAIAFHVIEYNGDDVEIGLQGKGGSEQVLPDEFRRSFALIFSRGGWSEILRMNKSALFLENARETLAYRDGSMFWENNRRLTVHRLSREIVLMEGEEIRHDDQFCWSLQKLIQFIERNEEAVKSMSKRQPEIVDSRRPLIGLEVGFPLASSASMTNASFKETGVQSRSGISLQMPVFATDTVESAFQTYAGLSFGMASLAVVASWEDATYEYDTDYSGLSELVVEQTGIEERVVFSSLTDVSFPLSFLAKLSEDGGISFRFSVRPGLISSGVCRSELIDGDFSFSGRVSGVQELISNVPSLGLEDGVQSSRFDYQYLSFHGRTLGLSGEVLYLGEKAGVALGFDSSWMRLSSTVDASQAGRSDVIGKYTSSFASNGLNVNQMGVRFSVIISVGQ